MIQKMLTEMAPFFAGMKDEETRRKIAEQQFVLTVDPEAQKSIEEFKDITRDLESVLRQRDIKKLEISGASKLSVDMAKMNDEMEKFLSTHETTIKDKKIEVELSDMLVYNESLRNAMQEAGKDIYADYVKLLEKGLQITTDHVKAMKEMGSYFKGAFKDAFKDLLDPETETTFSELAAKFGETLKDAWRDQFADVFADTLLDITGVDNIFGGAMKLFADDMKGLSNPISQAHLRAIEAGASIIYDAHVAGMQGGASGKGQTGTYGSRQGTAIGQALNTFLGPTSFVGKALAKPIFPKQTTYAGGGIGLPYGQLQGLAPAPIAGSDMAEALTFDYLTGAPGNQYVPSKDQMQDSATWGVQERGPSWGGVLSTAVSSVSSGMAAYQAAGGGAWGIGAGILGAYGAAAMMMPGGQPIGAALMLGSMLMGMFAPQPEQPAWRQEETREQTQQIASRIDVTNKSLEWVNRNLVELRQELTYILSESYYFSEKSEAERFSIAAARGQL